MRAMGGWKIGAYDPNTAESIFRSGSCKRLTAALLAARGQDSPQAASAFLRDDIGLLHDPFLLKDMSAAVERIRLAVAQGERIAVYGDYDVDGLTAAALMTTWFRRQGLFCMAHIPERLTEGYGITAEALRSVHRQRVTLLVTVDCGVTAVEQVEQARALGMDVVITDHHECQGELPAAVAVVNPQRKDCAYPFKGLAGVGVAFKLLCALEGPERLSQVLEEYGALVALGTIADIMPVTGENRCLIRKGIQCLRNRALPGPDSLMSAIGLDKSHICGTDISFSLVPKLNAAGRMGRVKTAFHLLMSDSLLDASQPAAELCEMNNERRNVENRVFQEAIAMMGELRHPDAPIVLASENWHQGVSGIVASRLAERFGVPAIVISLEGDEGRGSCRSFGGFQLFDALGAVSDELTTFGGHAMAAGLTLPRDRVDSLRSRLKAVYRATEGSRLQFRLPVDFAVKDLSLLTLEEVEGLRLLSPWGVGSPPPTLCIRDAHIESLTPIGGDKHLKMQATKDGRRFDCVFFGVTVRELALKPGSKVDLAFEPGINEFRGSRSLQLLLRDVRPARQPGDRSLDAARRFFEGKRMLPMELAMLCPDRGELSRVWRYLTRRARRFSEPTDTLLPEIALRASVPSLGRVFVCLRVFEELALLSLQEQEGELEIRIPRFEGKVDLNGSKILQRLR